MSLSVFLSYIDMERVEVSIITTQGIYTRETNVYIPIYPEERDLRQTDCRTPKGLYDYLIDLGHLPAHARAKVIAETGVDLWKGK